jgi:hypothetical protein
MQSNDIKSSMLSASHLAIGKFPRYDTSYIFMILFPIFSFLRYSTLGMKTRVIGKFQLVSKNQVQWYDSNRMVKNSKRGEQFER